MEILTPTILFFVFTEPADSTDAHGVRFSDAAIIHDRDVAFYDDAGDIVAYVAPIPEDPTIDTADALAHMGRWKASLQDPAPQFPDFRRRARAAVDSQLVHKTCQFAPRKAHGRAMTTPP